MKRLAEHRLGQVGRAEAGDIAILVLGFLTEDDERLDRFLTLSGLDRRDVAGQHELTAFRLAVLDYLASDKLITGFIFMASPIISEVLSGLR